MHKDFADWYRAVELEPQETILQKRWETIERLIATVDRAFGLDLVRLFAGLKPTSVDFSARFSEAFKTEDQAFPMKNNSAELRVLAGALCIAVIENVSQNIKLSKAIALAMAASLPIRSKFELQDIVSLAHAFLAQQSQTARVAGAQGNATPDLRAAIVALQQVCKGNNTIGHIEKELTTFTDKVADSLESLSKTSDVLKEETNILWWLMGGYSEDLGKPFGAVDAACMTLVAPKELVDRVVLIPGPVSARAFLSAALRQSHGYKDVSLAEAIEKTPKSWRQARFTNGQDDVLDLCPALLCVRRSLEGSKKEWLVRAARGVRIPIKEKLSPLDISHQFYTETLLIRALQNV